MTKYRLKDQDLQKALEKAAPGFSKALEEDFGNSYEKHHTLVYVGIKDKDRDTFLEINIPHCWVEKIKEYAPDEWNRYPDVIPPEGIQMRVEWMDRDGDLRHSCAAFREGRWIDSDNKYVRIERVSRFRPWE